MTLKDTPRVRGALVEESARLHRIGIGFNVLFLLLAGGGAWAAWHWDVDFFLKVGAVIAVAGAAVGLFTDVRRTLVVVLLSPGIYVIWWHVSFFLVLGLGGYSINYDLYSSYVRQFLFGLGLEIPTAIQYLAIAGTLLTVVLVLAVDGLRAALRARRAKKARAEQPPTRAV